HHAQRQRQQPPRGGAVPQARIHPDRPPRQVPAARDHANLSAQPMRSARPHALSAGDRLPPPPAAPRPASGVAGASRRRAAARRGALGVRIAYVVGISMGGAIAQRLALEHPARVATLTRIATTAIGPVSPDSPPLPPPSAELLDSPEPAQPDWADRAAVI